MANETAAARTLLAKTTRDPKPSCTLEKSSSVVWYATPMDVHESMCTYRDPWRKNQLRRVAVRSVYYPAANGRPEALVTARELSASNATVGSQMECRYANIGGTWRVSTACR